MAIIRIVVMHFGKTHGDEFLALFKKNSKAIHGFKGCLNLQLLKEVDHPFSYTTWSHWESVDSLNEYRKSPLFTGVWQRVKPLFSAPPQAYSFEKIDGVV